MHVGGEEGQSPEKAGEDFPIVAIGASAGGLEACRRLLAGIPADTTAAYILVLHLDPTHDSMIVDLLSRDTPLIVSEAREGQAVEPGNLYVIPPGQSLSVSHGHLHLTPPPPGQGVRLPFDFLLQSLTEDAGRRVICIVLSGTASDGSVGLAAVHSAGGLVIAQDPDEAGYSGMPESAMRTGKVDLVLPTAEMPIAVADHAASLMRPAGTGPAGTGPSGTGAAGTGAAGTGPDRNGGDDVSAGDQHPRETIDAKTLDAITALVKRNTSQDLTLYKSGTIERRIARRIALAGIAVEQPEKYLELLQSNPDEVDRLAADLLIHVTDFFRDPMVFERLADTAIPALINELPDNRPLRIWVAGCSTGEEAYSLAIVCREVFDKKGIAVRLQILASDIDDDAIATAREGFYPEAISSRVSPERLKQYFIHEVGGWRVTPSLRDNVIFTVLDLLSDPPFSRIDLVSCRNVLIYLGPEAQKRVIGLCGFALRPGGLLLLGSAETPGPLDGRFEVADKASRLWRRVGHSRPGDFHIPPGPKPETSTTTPPPAGRRTALADLCRRLVLEAYAPASVLMNRKLECLYLLGPTDRFLRVPPGHPSSDFLAMAPQSLRVRLRLAARACTADNPLETVTGGRTRDGQGFTVELRAVSAGSENLLLASFLEVAGHQETTDTDHIPSPGDSARIAELETELEATRRELSAALGDLESSVEEHSAEAAEAMSVSEEYQSTNEELLASKEELQALNEELNALNSQLQETLERHRTTANDLQNILYSTDVATIFLDQNLNIRFFTPAVRALFSVVPSDLGRPLANLAALSSDSTLIHDCRTILDGRGLDGTDLAEQEIAGADNVWFLRRIQPYRGEGGRVEGVVITYGDVTERRRTTFELDEAKQAAERANAAKSRFLAAASHDLRQPLQSLSLIHNLMATRKDAAEIEHLNALLDRTLRSMTEMLDTLLDVNRIDAGVIQPAIASVPLGGLMSRLAEEFGHLARDRGLRLSAIPCTAMMRTDPLLLEQILRNFLSNAIKYTRTGGIVLGCRRRGDRLRIEVWDSGIGISDEDLSGIFDPYHQLDITPRSAHGLGLGLSIVQRLADILGHQVGVRSRVGHGSVFSIEGDLAFDAAQGADPAGEGDAIPTENAPAARILLVENDLDLQDLLNRTLTNAGHTITAAQDATTALEDVNNGSVEPDLLVTDFDLHGGAGDEMNGLDLATAVSSALGRSIPTIILTGDISTGTLHDIGQSTFDLIAKPVRPDTLISRINALLVAAATSSDTPASKPAEEAPAQSRAIHVVDDDPGFRNTSRHHFEAEGWTVFTYPSAEEFLASPRPRGESCVLIDARLPGIDGISLVRLLQSRYPGLPSVMITGHGDAAMAVAAMKAGASDLIEKPFAAADLSASVARAMDQARDAKAVDEQRKAAATRLATLTSREQQVLEMVLAGAPNKNIAADLGINQRTVENHRAAVMRKTGAATLPDLVRLAIAAAQGDARQPLD